MKILLVGGFGLIGTELTSQFLNNGADSIYVSDRFCNLHKVSLDGQRIINSFRSHSEVVVSDDFSVVVHLGSQLLPASEINSVNLRMFLERDFLDAVELAYAARQHGVRNFVFVSSGGAVYKDRADAENFRESDPTEAINLYGINKLAIESYMSFLRSEGFCTLSLRVSNPYSHIQSAKKKQGIIPIFIRKIISDEPISIFGDGKNIRDFIHLSDAARAIKLACGYTGNSKIMNIGSGIGYSIHDIVLKICNVTRKSVRIEFFPDRGIDKRFAVLDSALALKELGWAASVDVDEGISLCLKHISDSVLINKIPD